jgi:hypothetical protein
MFGDCFDKLMEDDYAKRTDFGSEQAAFIDALVSVQKSISKLEAKMKPLKANKRTLTPEIIQMLQELNQSGIRVGKILMFLRGPGTKDPTAKQIVARAKETLSPQFVKKLEIMVADLQTVKSIELVTKTEKILPEGFRGFMGKLHSMVFGLSSKLKTIERMFNMQTNESIKEADDNYQHTIPVEVYLGSKVVGNFKETVNYRMEIAYRSWGIKDIDVFLTGNVNIELGNGRSINVNFDNVDCVIEWMAGGGYAPEGLEVNIDEQGNIKDCAMGFYYYDPTR